MQFLGTEKSSCFNCLFDSFSDHFFLFRSAPGFFPVLAPHNKVYLCFYNFGWVGGCVYLLHIILSVLLFTGVRSLYALQAVLRTAVSMLFLKGCLVIRVCLSGGLPGPSVCPTGGTQRSPVGLCCTTLVQSGIVKDKN